MTTVTLHVVSYVQPDKLTHRTIQYEQKKLTLIAVVSNEERDAPHGLRRLKLSELPKVGGLFGTAAVAKSEAEARAVILRVLESRLVAAKRDVACWETGIKLLTPSDEIPAVAGSSHAGHRSCVMDGAATCTGYPEK
jgi:hypothetical protein